VDERNQDGLKGLRNTLGNLVEEIEGGMPRIEVAGDISLRRPRPTQGCTAVMMMMMKKVFINRHHQRQ